MPRSSTARAWVATRSAAVTAALVGLVAPTGGCDRPRGRAEPGDAAAGQAVDGAPPAAREVPRLEPSGLESVEVVTGGASGAEPLPLVLALHGLGDDPERFSRLFDRFEGRARFVFPRGPLRFEDGRAWFLPGPEAAVSRTVRRAADGVAALADEVAASRPTRGKAVVTGFSQGGMIAFVVAARQPERVAAVVPVGAWLPEDAWPEAGRFAGDRPRVRALGGADDERASAADLRRCVVKLRMLGLDATARLYAETGHAVSPAMATDLFRILGSLVAGTEPPPPCEPCPGASMDPDACSLCPAGPPGPAPAPSAGGPGGPRAAGAAAAGPGASGPSGPDLSLGREGPASLFGAGSGEARGSLSREAIQQTFRRNMAPIRFCHERALESRPGLSGRLSVRFVVAPDGSVSSAEVASSTLGEAEVEECVRRAVTRVVFPRLEGGEAVAVTYPFTFAAAQR